MAITLGLDIGTTSVAAVAVDSEGTLVRRASRDHRADLRLADPYRAEQSPERIWQCVCEVLTELTATDLEPPTCMGITGQMHGTLLVDGELNPLGPLITWRDRRALEHDAGTDALTEFRSSVREDLETLERTGCSPAAGFLGVTLFSLIRDGELPATARWALILADWVAARLSGAEPCTDPTNAASTGVFDLSERRWSDLIDWTGLPRELFPPIAESGAPLGGLTGDLAKRLGLPAGLLVSVAIGDHQAALLGSLPADASAMAINIGTGGQISIPIERFLRLPGSETRYLPDDRFILVGAGLAGGDSYAWLKETLLAWAQAFGADLLESEIYEKLARLVAETPDDCDGLTAEPFFRGTRADPDRRGRFQGVAFNNFTPGHVGRAILDGIARTFAEFYEAHQPALDSANEPARLIATGNAVRANPELAAALARAFRRPVFAPSHREEAAVGAALLAGVRAEIWPDLRSAWSGIQLVRLA